MTKRFWDEACFVLWDDALALEDFGVRLADKEGAMSNTEEKLLDLMLEGYYRLPWWKRLMVDWKRRWFMRRVRKQARAEMKGFIKRVVGEIEK